MANLFEGLFEELVADMERSRVKRRLKAAFARNPRPAKPRNVSQEDAMLRNSARRSSKLIAKGGQHGAE